MLQLAEVVVSDAKRIACLVDSRTFRRAVLEHFLASWANENEIELVALHPADLLEQTDKAGQWAIAIFAIGGQTIGDSGVERQVRVIGALSPDSKMAVVSDLDCSAEVKAALTMGFDGFLPSNISPDLGLRALTFILNGGSYFPPSAIGEPNPQEDPADEPPQDSLKNSAPLTPLTGGGRPKTIHDEPEGEARVPCLTRRQREVLVLLKEGCPNKVIANRLGMTEATVKVHMRQIMRKLGAENRTQAAICAAKLTRDSYGTIVELENRIN